MEQVESIPFSALIAGMLLCKKSYNSAEVVNMISELEGQGIWIEDENDDMVALSCCVEMSLNYDFHLKEGLGYNTVLSPGVTVFDFLMIHTDERILSFLEEQKNIHIFYQEDIQKISENTILQDTFFKKDRHPEIFGIKKRVLAKKKLPFQNMNRSEAVSIDWSALLG